MKIYPMIKRGLDILLSGIAIIFLLPFFIILCACCALDTKASPLFLQERIGKDRKPFKIIKFRTMKKNAPSGTPARAIANHNEYVSNFGLWLRKSGADELPQVFNIFVGQMSFVGPRPLMSSEKALHRAREEFGAYSVRPGLTGLAQISCESINSVEEKALLDAEYAKNSSFCFDLKLIFMTAKLFLCGNHIDEHFDSPAE